MKLIAFVQSYLATLHRDTKGASAIEYAIIAGLIAVALIFAATTLGGSVADLFDVIEGELPAAAPTS